MALDPLLGIVALPLLFFLPGFALGAALFPEKLRTGAGTLGPVELVVLGVVGSTAITVLIGSLLTATPAGVGTTPGDPTLWIGDGLVTLVGLGLWVVRRNAPVPEGVRDAPEEENAWTTLRTLERLAREERQLRRSLRSPSLGAGAREELEGQLAEVARRKAHLLERTEAQHAS